MDWNALTAISTTFYAAVFTIAALTTLFATIVQLKDLEKRRRFQATIAVFRELKARDFVEDRRYIYDNLPEKTEGIEAVQLKEQTLQNRN